MDKQELLRNMDEIEKEAKRLLQDESIQWENADTESGLSLKWHSTGYWAGSTYRFEKVIDCGIEKLLDSLYIPHRAKWDVNMESTEILEELDERTLLIKMSMKPSFEGLVSARDAIEVMRYEVDGLDRVWIIQGSLDGLDEKYPAEDGFVRSFVHPTGVLLTKIDANHTHFLCCIQMDIKGWIPITVTDMKMPEALEAFLQNLTDHVTAGGSPSSKGKPGRKAISTL